MAREECVWGNLSVLDASLFFGWRSSCSGRCDGQKLHIKDQRSIGRDDAFVSVLSIGQLRRDAQLPLAADLHAGHAFVPTFDNVPLPERETVWLVGVDGTVELLSGCEPPGVMHSHVIAALRLVAGANIDVPILQSGVRLDAVARDLSRGICVGNAGRSRPVIRCLRREEAGGEENYRTTDSDLHHESLFRRGTKTVVDAGDAEGNLRSN